MADNVVNVKLKLSAEGVAAQQKAAKDIADNYERANKALSSPSRRASPAPTSRAEATAPFTTSQVTEREYGKVRGAVGTGAAGRDFAKQAQGLGGLVALYATFAANIFAVGAAFEALNKAAQVERLAKATELMSAQVGVNLKSVSKNLVEASGYALSFAEAMQFTNIGTSAGLAGKQVENLTKIAKGAAIALGRDVGDSVRRIIQGTAKQEQEILDELGIFVKSKQAFDKYAAAIGVKVDALTGTQRTQAYANEVERLGKKWEQFAEIDDPFSRFTATGKNALNDLLAGVNSLFTPLLSFLAQSKEGIQGIIVLVATMLSKRALPELGNMLNNIFTFDKQVAISRAIEARSAIGKELAALEKQALETKKAMESIKIGATTTDTISSGLGVTPYTKGGQKDISATKLANTFNKTPEAYLTILDAEKSTLGIMKEQLKASKNKDLLLSSLIEKGRLEGKSTLDNLILGEKGKGIAIAMNAKANEAIILERQKISLAEINLAIEEKTLALKKAGGALTNQQNTLSKLGTAKNAINTAASEGSRAIDAAIPQGFGPFNTKVYSATRDAILSVAAASKVSSAGLGVMATASLLASTATNMLGIALKGALAFLGPLAMALMTAYTVWSIFGETIKEYLPNWAKVLMGWDEGSKKAEAANAKLKEYNESLGYSAAQLHNLNEIRSKGFDSIDEEARYADTLLKNILATTEAYKKYTEEKAKSVAEDSLAKARKEGGISFSEDAYRLNELAAAYKKLLPEETLSRMKVLAANMSIATEGMAKAKKGTEDYVYWEEKLNALRKEGARISQEEALPAAQKYSAATESVKNAVNSVASALENERKARLKLGDVDLGLTTENAVQIYRGFEKILNESVSTEIKFVGASESLAAVISTGGAAAEVAKQAYISLWQAKLMAIAAGKDGVMDSAIIEAELEKLKHLALGIAILNNKPVKPTRTKQPKEYTQPEIEALKALSNQIKSTEDALTLLESTFKNDSALDARSAKLRGYSTELENAAVKANELAKAELEYKKDLDTADKAYKSEVYKNSATPTSIKEAEYTLKRAKEISLQKLDQAKSAAEIKNIDDDIATTQRKITDEFDKQKAINEEAESLYQNKLEVSEAEEGLRRLGLEYSVKELAYLKQGTVLAKAAHDKNISYLNSEFQLGQKLRGIAASGAKPEDMSAAATKALNEYDAANRSADAKYNTDVKLANIATQTSIKEENLKTADSIRDNLTDAFMGAVESGESLFKSLKNSVKSMFNNMVLKPIIKVGMTGALGALGIGASGSANAGDSFGLGEGASILSQGKSLWDTASSGGGSLTNFLLDRSADLADGMFKAGFDGMGNAVYDFAESMAGYADIIDTAGGVLGYASAFNAALNGEWGNAVGTAIGTAILPGVGTAIGSFLGGAVDKMFGGGGGPKVDSSYGLNYTSQGDNSKTGIAGSFVSVTENAWASMAKSLGILSELKVGSLVSLDPAGDAKTIFDATGNLGGNSVYNRAARLGGAENVGRSEAELQAAMTEETTRILFAALVASDLPEQYSTYLDSISASLPNMVNEADRLLAMTTAMSNVVIIHDFTAALSALPFENLKNLSFDAAAGLIAASGGLQALDSNLGAYYTNFYSAEEQRAQQIKTINSTVGNGFDAGTTSAEEFRTIVDTAMKDTSASGLVLTSKLLSVSGGMAELTKSVETTGMTIAEITRASFDQYTELLSTQGRTYEATLRERAIKLDDLFKQDSSLITIQKEIYAQEALNKTRELEKELLNSSGRAAHAVVLSREEELLSLSKADTALQVRIWRLQDEAALLDKKNSQEAAIYTLLGNAAAALQITREKELATMEEQLKPGQLYLYALQDEADLKSKLKTAYDKEKTAIKGTIDSISGLIKTLKNIKDSLLLGDLSPKTPTEKYAEANSQLMSTFAIANSTATTDAEILARDTAVNKLPELTSTFLTASRELYASSDQYTQDFNKVLGILDTTGETLILQQTDAEKQLGILTTIDTSLSDILDTSYDSAYYLELLSQNAPKLKQAKYNASVSGYGSAGGKNTTPVTNTLPNAKVSNAKVSNGIITGNLGWSGTFDQARTEVVDYLANDKNPPRLLLDNLINQGIDSVLAAQFMQLPIEQVRSWAANLGVPGFAKGGYASGVAMVGEQGPELVDFRTPGRVYTADQTSEMLTPHSMGSGLGSIVKEMVTEIQQLRKEVAKLRQDQQKQTGDIIISNYDANQKAADSVTTAVTNTSTNIVWAARSASALK